MVFSSIEFLFFFLPVTLLLYRLAPTRLKNAVLLVASLVFYIWGGGVFVLLLVASIVVDYFAGWLVAWALANHRVAYVRLGIFITVAVNLGLLSYFKYANFAVEQLNSLGYGQIAWNSVALPIGISFYTFQSMSYTIDVARGRARHLTNPVDFALYVALFPQLIAGPIVRFHEIASQMRERRTHVPGFAEGAVRFCHGLVKKVIVADTVSVVADAAFAAGGDSLNTPAAWLGVIAYTLQIYFDFSGYSDMAIGLGKMFGFSFPENFRRPYSAVSVTDFWRRWHITLSNWFRDYLYIPLGGGRGTVAATYRNLIIVFLLTGLWHGANWTFVVWGAYHGGLLIAERVTGQRPVAEASHRGLRRTLTLLLVIIGWVVFRAESVAAALEYLGAMFAFDFGESAAVVAEAMTGRVALTMAVASAVFLAPADFVGGTFLLGAGRRAATARFALLAAGLPYAMILIGSGTFSPFLYFQF